VRQDITVNALTGGANLIAVGLIGIAGYWAAMTSIRHTPSPSRSSSNQATLVLGSPVDRGKVPEKLTRLDLKVLVWRALLTVNFPRGR
jgi:hypothetical protein